MSKYIYEYIICIRETLYSDRFASLILKLTCPHVDAHSTPGYDAGDLKRPAALWAHHAVPELQAAFWAAFLFFFVLVLLFLLRFGIFVFLRLSLLHVMGLLIPIVTFTFSHVPVLRWNTNNVQTDEL